MIARLEKKLSIFLPGLYGEFLKTRQCEYRTNHSLEVMEMMGELSCIYTLDSEAAMTAGLLHDAARDFGDEKLKQKVEEWGVVLDHPCEEHGAYLHAKIGAELIQRELGLDDDLILDAVSSHSYGNGGNHYDSNLAWCLRLADKLTPSREWPGLVKLRQMLLSGRLEESALLAGRWMMEYFESAKIPVHPNHRNSLEKLSLKLSKPPEFFER